MFKYLVICCIDKNKTQVIFHIDMLEFSPIQNSNSFALQTEVLWCVEQLELSLQSGKLNEKRAAEIRKSIKTLKNPQAPLIKVRQLMRSHFGDYRYVHFCGFKGGVPDLYFFFDHIFSCNISAET